MLPRIFACLLLMPLLGGCIAKTALDVVTAPVKVAGQAADWATTSQDEADRNRGREIRRQEEQAARAERERRRDCRDAGYRYCD